MPRCKASLALGHIMDGTLHSIAHKIPMHKCGAGLPDAVHAADGLLLHRITQHRLDKDYMVGFDDI